MNDYFFFLSSDFLVSPVGRSLVLEASRTVVLSRGGSVLPSRTGAPSRTIVPSRGGSVLLSRTGAALSNDGAPLPSLVRDVPPLEPTGGVAGTVSAVVRGLVNAPGAVGADSVFLRSATSVCWAALEVCAICRRV